MHFKTYLIVCLFVCLSRPAKCNGQLYLHISPGSVDQVSSYLNLQRLSSPNIPNSASLEQKNKKAKKHLNEQLYGSNSMLQFQQTMLCWRMNSKLNDSSFLIMYTHLQRQLLGLLYHSFPVISKPGDWFKCSRQTRIANQDPTMVYNSGLHRILKSLFLSLYVTEKWLNNQGRIVRGGRRKKRSY